MFIDIPLFRIYSITIDICKGTEQMQTVKNTGESYVSLSNLFLYDHRTK